MLSKSHAHRVNTAVGRVGGSGLDRGLKTLYNIIFYFFQSNLIELKILLVLQPVWLLLQH